MATSSIRVFWATPMQGLSGEVVNPMSAEEVVTNRDKGFFVGSATFGLCLALINAWVWISGFDEITEQPSETNVVTQMLLVAQRTDHEAEQEESTNEDVSTHDQALFGMSQEEYDRIQQRFLEGVRSSRSTSSPSPSSRPSPSSDPSPSPSPNPSSTPNPTPSQNTRPPSRPTRSPQPSPQPTNDTLFNAGGPSSGPVPFRPNGTCPSAFPIMLTWACYST
jgi:outer membrane biosynthesis protein TonB